MKLEPLEAIKELTRKLRLINAFERKTIDGQRTVAALEMGIEAIRRQIGYPPNLPGYITLHKSFGAHPACYKYFKPMADHHPTAAWYLSREMLAVLKTARLDGAPIVTMTEQTCYDPSEPLLCGLPVIYGDSQTLSEFVYLVAKENQPEE